MFADAAFLHRNWQAAATRFKLALSVATSLARITSLCFETAPAVSTCYGGYGGGTTQNAYWIAATLSARATSFLS